MRKLLSLAILVISFSTHGSFCGNDKFNNLAVTEEEAREISGEEEEEVVQDLDYQEREPNHFMEVIDEEEIESDSFVEEEELES